ncbi:sugar ABC transporter substrate-binding protein [Streptomyces sulfonofaciens]|uniref:Sugar ABC transporter substrate-binding protein n=1 Tax=Streptomyces sulfonofaciens TaxID=68272 RepID=A0A919FW85_9ACTN|nr:sugar ABC transporter substrate-binding protein [Streptomyces sulfonofaciens]GHH73144.1 sugar ABC transporter substrate-binding protein [Streptomyces sulfonofaciens]
MLTALTALPLAGAVSACGSGGSSSGGSKGVTRLTFWSALRGSQQVVDEFNRTHERIQVDFEQIPSGTQGGYLKLSNAARAGNSPDVATIEYPEVPEFAIDGVARDITPLVDGGLRRKLLPQSLGLTTFKKRIYSVPLDVEPMVMHYRKDLFDRFGIEVPRTWDEFEQAARTVRRRAPERRLAVFPTDGAETFAAFAWQAGAQWYDIRDGAWNISLADEPTRRVAAYWQRLVDEDLVFANPGTGKLNDAQIGRGLLLARFSGAWDAGAQMNARPAQKGDWRIAGLPQWDPDRPVVSTQGGSTFAVTKDCRHPEAAMEFIAWQVCDPASLRARLSSGASSQYPAAPGLVQVGRKAFDRSYYGGQDIYRLFDEEARKIGPNWRWGPRMRPTVTVMQDGFARMSGGRQSVIGAVRAAQRGTMPDLRALGLATTQHST